MKPDHTLGSQEVHRFLDGLFDGDLHAKRVLSLANATLGVLRTASLAVNTIGQGLALARGLVTKHAIKQVDRLLSNEGIDIDAALRHWVPYVVGPRTSINVAMDWTDFDADGQATMMLCQCRLNSPQKRRLKIPHFVAVQSRPYPRGGSMSARSVRSRSTMACKASPVAVSRRASGRASAQAT